METSRGQNNRPFGWGADARPSKRPGVPMERVPPAPLKGAHRKIETQPMSTQPRKRIETPIETPVFGTAQPISGLSGFLRSAAYRIPQHKTRHWLLLMAADRVELFGYRMTKIGLPIFLGGLGTAGFLVFRNAYRIAKS